MKLLTRRCCIFNEFQCRNSLFSSRIKGDLKECFKSTQQAPFSVGVHRGLMSSTAGNFHNTSLSNDSKRTKYFQDFKNLCRNYTINETPSSSKVNNSHEGFQEQTHQQESSVFHFWKSFFHLWSKLSLRYFLIAFGALFIFWVIWSIVRFFGKVTMDEVFRWAFLTGFCSALGLAVTMKVYKSQIAYKAKKIQSIATQRILGNKAAPSEICQLLADGNIAAIHQGKIRAYGFEFGRGGLVDPYSHFWVFLFNYFVLRRQKLEVIFQLLGKNERMAIVSCMTDDLPRWDEVEQDYTLRFDHLEVKLYGVNGQQTRPAASFIDGYTGDNSHVDGSPVITRIFDSKYGNHSPPAAGTASGASPFPM